MSTIPTVQRVCGACAFLLVLYAPLAAQGLRVNGELARGEGFAAGDTLAFQLSPDGRWAVFYADPAGDDLMELFSAPADGSAGPRRLNGPLVAGGTVVETYTDPHFGVVFFPHPVAIGADRVVYRGDQDTDEVFELYSAPIDGSAPPVKLSGVLPAGADVGFEFEVTPDGARILFVADQETDGMFELYSVPIDGSAPPVRLNAQPASGGSFEYYGPLDARVSADGRTVVYRLDQASDGVFELFAVPADGSASPLRLNRPPVQGGDVVSFQISPDGARVVYMADTNVNDLFFLWSVPIDAASAPTRLSAPTGPGGRLGAFDITPDGARVVYVADAELDGLFSVPIGGGTALLLAAPFGPSGAILDFLVSPDSARVVYRGDAAEDEVYELFAVPLDGSAPALRLCGPFAAGAGLHESDSYLISPDGSRVVYRADQASLEVRELWSVPIDGGMAPVRLNGALPSGGQVRGRFRCSAGGTRVVYEADQVVRGRIELWSAPILGDAAPLRLNERLVTGGEVAEENSWSPHSGFDLSADGTRVVYRADQHVNEQFALWSVPLDHRRRAHELSGALEPGPVLGDVRHFAWSNDGQRLLYTADQELDEAFVIHSVVVDPRDPGTPFSTRDLGPGLTLQPSPDGRYVASELRWFCPPEPGCVGGVGLLCAAVDGSSTPWSAGMGNFARESAFDPRGEWLVYTTEQLSYHNPVGYGGMFARRTDGSGASISLTEPPGMVAYLSAGPPVISPDAARVIFAQGIAGQYSQLMSVPIDRSQPPIEIGIPLYDARQLFQPTYLVTPNARTVVYVADQEERGIFELYSVPLDGAALPVRLGPPLPAFADFDSAFLLALDGERVFARLDPSHDDSFELWSLPTVPARGEPALQLSAKPVPGGGVAPGRALLSTAQASNVPEPQFALSPDGKRIAYRADQDIDEVYELYGVPSDGSAAPVKLNAPLAPGRSVPAFGFRFTPDGGTVVYAAPDGAGVLRLHAVPSDASAPPLELGGPFVAGGALWLSPYDAAAPTFELTADGLTAVYLADQRTDETIELFAVPLDASRPARVLNGALAPGGDVHSLTPEQRPFALSPDGKRVAYLADQRTDEVVELFESYLEHPRVRPATLPE